MPVPITVQPTTHLHLPFPSLAVQAMPAGVRYRPKTRETQSAYELLLSWISGLLGSQPRDILCGAADEILETLKTDRFKVRVRSGTVRLANSAGLPMLTYGLGGVQPAERKAEVEQLVGRLSEEQMGEVSGLSKRITDFSVGPCAPRPPMRGEESV